MSTFRSGPRPLPPAPGRDPDQREALWYEHEERMRPSYIQMPSRAQQQDGWGRTPSPSGRSPGTASLASRTSNATHDVLRRSPMVSPNAETQRAQWIEPTPSQSRLRASNMQTTPSRIRPTSLRPFDADEARRLPKGSAFMHKGFLDILNLVNSPSHRSGTGAIKATISRATGRLRKMSGTGQALRPDFFDGPSPALSDVPTAVAGPRPPPSPYSAEQASPNSRSASPSPGMISGPRLQKKRISTQMVGAPRPESFVHTAHASDAEQAEELLRRWGVEGAGQPAETSWTDRCKEALRAQAQRNEEEAIADLQAALQRESKIRTGQLDTPPGKGNEPMGTLKGRKDAGASELTLRKGLPRTQDAASPQSPKSNDTVFSKRSINPPAEMNPAGVQGTVLMAPGTASRQETLPDYLQYRPQADAQGTTRLVDGLPSLREDGGDNFRTLLSSRNTPQVPAVEKTVARNLAGEEMSSALAHNAGAAMQPSLATVEKSVAAKIYFENLYFGILKKPQARETRRAGLEAELAGLRISDEMKASIRQAWAANETEYLRDIRARVSANSFTKLKTIGHGAFGVVALVRERQTGQVFAMKQLRKADMLRKGQEGHIRAERDLMTSASASTTAKWIVKLVYSFQDTDHLYLIMEFMGGGDLLNLLIERDIFEEDFARFYVAEMILAINEAHKFGYIHRDIKPDNFLFSSDGHIKLADFGLCQSFHWAHDGAYYEQQRKQLLKRHGIDLEDAQRSGRNAASARSGAVTSSSTRGNAALSDKELDKLMSDRNKDGSPQTHVLTWREKNKKKLAYSVVGTNNYMAPEVLRGLGYDQSCDWWSLGVIVFEMLYGYPPFVSKSRHMTRQKILNWKQTLKFPPKPKISRDAQDFIKKLICERDDRLGSVATASVSRPNSLMQGSRQQSGFSARGNGTDAAAQGLTDGVDDLMAHKWFRGTDWRSLHVSPAPYVPDLSHAADTKHFEDDIEDAPLPAPGAAEAIKNGLPPPVEEPRDPMLRDKAQGAQLLEMRKQLAFVGYTFKSPKGFDPRTQLTDSKIRNVEELAAAREAQQEHADVADAMGMSLQHPMTQSRLRSMSM